MLLKAARRALFNLGVLGLLLLSVGPLIWIAISSFRPKTEFFRRDPTLLPTRWTIDNYLDLVHATDFPGQVWNSVIVAAVTVVSCTVVASLASYSLARFKYRGRGVFMIGALFAYMLPQVLLAIPLYVLGSRMGLLNRLSGLSIAYIALCLPYSIWILRAFFTSIPFELEEAAAIDGASTFRILWSVVMPISLPGIIATAVYSFNYVWNDYLFALVFITDEGRKTFPLGLSSFITEFDVYWEYVLTGSVLVAIPSLAILLPTQRLLIKGWGSGALKE